MAWKFGEKNEKEKSIVIDIPNHLGMAFMYHGVICKAVQLVHD